MKRTTLWFAAVAVISAMAMAIPSLTSSAQAADTSQVYVVHGIPDTPVDVYVAGKLTLTDFQPKDVAGPLALPAGDYKIQIFAHVTDPPQDAPASGAVINETKSVPAGKSVSLIANLDADGNAALNAFVNNESPVASGMARVTVRHTAAAPAVDIYVDGAKAVPDLTNPNEAVAEIPTGSHEIAVKLAGTDTTVIGPATLDFAANTNTVVYAIGSPRRGELKSTLDVVVQTLDTAMATPDTEAPTTTVAPAPMKPAAPMAAQPTYTG